MTTEINLTDDELLEQIENCTLDTSKFTHESMLRLAWILINKYSLEVAIEKNKRIKENYFINALKSEKFNVTLSKAYVEILDHFKERSTTNNFDILLEEFPRLKYNFRNLVKTHYGYNILKEHRKEEPKPSNRPILFTF